MSAADRMSQQSTRSPIASQSVSFTAPLSATRCAIRRPRSYEIPCRPHKKLFTDTIPNGTCDSRRAEPPLAYHHLFHRRETERKSFETFPVRWRPSREKRAGKQQGDQSPSGAANETAAHYLARGEARPPAAHFFFVLFLRSLLFPCSCLRPHRRHRHRQAEKKADHRSRRNHLDTHTHTHKNLETLSTRPEGVWRAHALHTSATAAVKRPHILQFALECRCHRDAPIEPAFCFKKLLKKTQRDREKSVSNAPPSGGGKRSPRGEQVVEANERRRNKQKKKNGTTPKEVERVILSPRVQHSRPYYTRPTAAGARAANRAPF